MRTFGRWLASANLTDGSAYSAAEADFQFRTSGSNVVWYHDFRNEDEVNNFRWTGELGNDPSGLGSGSRNADWVRRVTGDGVTGDACLELFRATGSAEASSWWRPFSALSGGSDSGGVGPFVGNGRGVDDPAANVSLTVHTDWTPDSTTTAGKGTMANWDRSFYGHLDGHGEGQFDGQEYWIQCQIKVNAGRDNAGSEGGKVFYFTRNDQSNTSQEIVTMIRDVASGTTEPNFFSMYRSGSPPLSNDDPGVSVHGNQPGTEWGTVGDGICRFDDNGGRRANCWDWPYDQWFTLLYQINNGHSAANDTLIAVYAVRPGELDYTRIWFQPGADLPFDVVPGHNALICSSFFNGLEIDEDISNKYDQIIFSKQWIPAPNTKDSVLGTAALALDPGEWVDVTANTTQDQHDIQWNLATIFYDEYRRELQYTGKPASNQTPPNYSHYVYSEKDDAWTDVGEFSDHSTGHIWQYAFDPLTGRYFVRVHGSDSLKWFDREAGVFLSSWKDTSAKDTTPTLSNGNLTAYPMGWHPNLFGPNQGGVVVCNSFRFFAYRPTDDTWHVMNPASWPNDTAYRTRDNGQMLYVPEIDALIGWAQANPDYSGAGDGHQAWRIYGGAGASSDILADGLIDTAGSPPLLIAGKGGEINHGHIIQHPDDPNRLICLEEWGSERVWDSTDYGDTWTLKGYTHPFITGSSPNMSSLNAGEFTIGRIGPYRSVVGMTSSSSGGTTRLWRPND